MFRLRDRPVRALMAPPAAIAWLDLDDSPDDLRRKIAGRPDCSDFVVCQGGPENVLGVASAEALLARCLSGQPINLQTALQPPLVVPEGQSALALPELFKQAGARLALVVDKYGGVRGIVTVASALEGLAAGLDRTQPRALRLQDDAWLVDGLLPVDQFNTALGVEAAPGGEGSDYQTVGGFVMMSLGRIPSVADSFEWGGLRFEVIDMHGHRVHKVLVKRPGP